MSEEEESKMGSEMIENERETRRRMSARYGRLYRDGRATVVASPEGSSQAKNSWPEFAQLTRAYVIESRLLLVLC